MEADKIELEFPGRAYSITIGKGENKGTILIHYEWHLIAKCYYDADCRDLYIVSFYWNVKSPDARLDMVDPCQWVSLGARGMLLVRAVGIIVGAESYTLSDLWYRRVLIPGGVLRLNSYNVIRAYEDRNTQEWYEAKDVILRLVERWGPNYRHGFYSQFGFVPFGSENMRARSIINTA